MALVTFPLNELALRDLSLGERVEDEVRRTLARYEPRDLLVECRITVQPGDSEPNVSRIGVTLSAAASEGQPGWALDTRSNMPAP